MYTSRDAHPVVQRTDWWPAGSGRLARTECSRITTPSELLLHCCFDYDPCRIAGMLDYGKGNRCSPSVCLFLWNHPESYWFMLYFISSGYCRFFYFLIALVSSDFFTIPFPGVKLWACWATSSPNASTLQFSTYHIIPFYSSSDTLHPLPVKVSFMTPFFSSLFSIATD